ncbi:hypothetical protein [Paraburkholderia sp. JHI869]|uniref:hypothetical protein n=1 Tax=Paraburkholderia sp. JHI869 TaxID=3112959 RepID=UPI003174E4A7
MHQLEAQMRRRIGMRRFDTADHARFAPIERMKQGLNAMAYALLFSLNRSAQRFSPQS